MRRCLLHSSISFGVQCRCFSSSLYAALQFRLSCCTPSEALNALVCLHPSYENPSLLTHLSHTAAGHSCLLPIPSCITLLEQWTNPEALYWKSKEAWATSLEAIMDTCSSSRLQLSALEETILFAVLTAWHLDYNGRGRDMLQKTSGQHRKHHLLLQYSHFSNDEWLKTGSLLIAYLSQSTMSGANELELFVAKNIVLAAFPPAVTYPFCSTLSAAPTEEERNDLWSQQRFFRVSRTLRCWSILFYRALPSLPNYKWKLLANMYIDALTNYTNCISHLRSISVRKLDSVHVEEDAIMMLCTSESLFNTCGPVAVHTCGEYWSKIWHLHVTLAVHLSNIVSTLWRNTKRRETHYSLNGEKFTREDILMLRWVNITHVLGTQLILFLSENSFPTELHRQGKKISPSFEMMIVRCKLLLRRSVRCIHLQYFRTGATSEYMKRSQGGWYRVWVRLVNVVQIVSQITFSTVFSLSDEYQRLVQWGCHLLRSSAATWKDGLHAPDSSWQNSRDMTSFLVSFLVVWEDWIPRFPESALVLLYRDVFRDHLNKRPSTVVSDWMTSQWRRIWNRENSRLLHHLELESVICCLSEYVLRKHSRNDSSLSQAPYTYFLLPLQILKKEMLELCVDQLLEVVRHPDTVQGNASATPKVRPTVTYLPQTYRRSQTRAEDEVAELVSQADPALFQDLGYFLYYMALGLGDESDDRCHGSCCAISSLEKAYQHLWDVWLFTLTSSLPEEAAKMNHSCLRRFIECSRFPVMPVRMDLEEGVSVQKCCLALTQPVLLAVGGQPVITAASLPSRDLLLTLYIWDAMKMGPTFLSHRHVPVSQPRVQALFTSLSSAQHCGSLISPQRQWESAFYLLFSRLGNCSKTTKPDVDTDTENRCALLVGTSIGLLRQQRIFDLLYGQFCCVQSERPQSAVGHPSEPIPLSRTDAVTALFDRLSPCFPQLFDNTVLSWIKQWKQHVQLLVVEEGGADDADLFHNESFLNTVISLNNAYHLLSLLMRFPAETCTAVPLGFVLYLWRRVGCGIERATKKFLRWEQHEGSERYFARPTALELLALTHQYIDSAQDFMDLFDWCVLVQPFLECRKISDAYKCFPSVSPLSVLAYKTFVSNSSVTHDNAEVELLHSMGGIPHDHDPPKKVVRAYQHFEMRKRGSLSHGFTSRTVRRRSDTASSQREDLLRYLSQLTVARTVL